MAKSIILLVIISLAQVHFSSSQTNPDPLLNEKLVRASEQTKEYVKVFRNLAATEKKTFTLLRPDGSVKKNRSVESNIIVYQLSANKNAITEYRHVYAVDGKRLNKADNRAQDFFEKLMKVENSAKELEQIKKESLRYDDDLQIDGYTLFQGAALNKVLIPVLQFYQQALETIDGKETVVVKYNQVHPSRHILLYNKYSSDVDNALLSLNLDDNAVDKMQLRLRGTMWLDKATMQIRRETRELTIQSAEFPTPMLILQTNFMYQDSEFDILTPKKIDMTVNRLDRKRSQTVPEMKVTFEYSSFSKPDVEVQSSEVKGKEN